MRLQLLLIFILTAALRASACDCKPPATPGEAYVAADIVFTGKVLRAEPNWVSGGMKYTFAVSRSWKQHSDAILYLNSGFDDACGYAFETGKSYLVYATKKFTSWQSSRCTRNAPLEAAAEDMAMLGEGNATQGSAMRRRMAWTIGALGLISILGLALIVLRKQISPKKPS